MYNRTHVCTLGSFCTYCTVRPERGLAPGHLIKLSIHSLSRRRRRFSSSPSHGREGANQLRPFLLAAELRARCIYRLQKFIKVSGRARSIIYFNTRSIHHARSGILSRLRSPFSRCDAPTRSESADTYSRFSRGDLSAIAVS